MQNEANVKMSDDWTSPRMVGALNQRDNALRRSVRMEAAESNNDKRKHNGKRHDLQFKTAAAKLVTEQGYTPKQAALSLGVKISTLQYWVKRYGGGRAPQQEAETIET